MITRKIFGFLFLVVLNLSIGSMCGIEERWSGGIVRTETTDQITYTDQGSAPYIASFSYNKKTDKFNGSRTDGKTVSGVNANEAMMRFKDLQNQFNRGGH